MKVPINRQVAQIDAGQLAANRSSTARTGTSRIGASRIDAAGLADLLGHWSAPDGPLYRMLATRIGRLADTGELPPGLRLPPERELASALAMSRNTVAMAYQRLRDEGMASSRQGSGTRIVPHRTTPGAVHRANGFFARVLATADVRIDLSMADVECAPQVAAALEDPASMLDRATRREITGSTGYFPYGVPLLRAAIASVLTTRYGLPTRPEEVLVTTGGQQALDLLARSELAPGQSAVTEDPTFPGGLDALRRSATRLVGVPPGDISRLERAVEAHRPGLVYLVPTYHNPLGTSLSLASREAVIALAAAHPDVVFIDDMVMADMGLTDTALPPTLAALAPGLPNVVTIGSLSKAYWCGLRIGWIRAPEGIIARLAATKSAADLGSAAYQQAVVAAVVAGQHDEIVKWRRDWLRPQYDALADAFRERLPDWTWTTPKGGLTVWARLPGETDSGAFAEVALRHGVAVVPGRLLSAGDSPDAARHVRIAYTRPPEQMADAVSALAAAFAQAGDFGGASGRTSER
jgi:DNA-binding transcriptional MocR family regulator